MPRAIDPATAQRVVRALQRDPVLFVAHVLKADPWAKQVEILRAVRDYPRVAVRSCHGAGKSYTAGLAILWFLFSFRPSIVLSTAPTWRQVEKLVWKEVRSAYARAGGAAVLGGHLLPKRPELQIIQDQWYAAGLSTDNPDRFQGFHERNILVVVDEAAGVPEDIFEAVEGVLTSENARLLLLGNPTAVGGTFYRAFREPGWYRLSISAFDTPNFTAYGITPEDIASGEWQAKIAGPLPKPGLITPGWVADKYLRWGQDSPAYQSRVLGNFPAQAEDTLIPLAWIEAAMARWEDTPDSEPVELGVDVARFGSDNTVIAVRRGAKIVALRVYAQRDTMETAGHVIAAMRETGARLAKVDVIGIGAGVVDRLAEQRVPVVGVNVAEAPRDPERFVNLRSELWWGLRERLDPNPRLNPHPVALPPDDELLAELSAVKYRIDSRGRIEVESKDAMKKRLGRSPDRADAVVLAFAAVGGVAERKEDLELLRSMTIYGGLY